MLWITNGSSKSCAAEGLALEHLAPVCRVPPPSQTIELGSASFTCSVKGGTYRQLVFNETILASLKPHRHLVELGSKWHQVTEAVLAHSFFGPGKMPSH